MLSETGNFVVVVVVAFSSVCNVWTLTPTVLPYIGIFSFFGRITLGLFDQFNIVDDWSNVSLSYIKVTA